ncbi:uncharacterized protein CLUP02_17533 [Colletotrichum lupini]|uniref:Uncharacterized protein n=1 Tax=Colletotrichum lupini TaxID=145971 RepID=A0A9Q8SGD9_9PEZI|nr:uncharacterized protein CLUP02_17533 [Colletotrichum lupini]UQC76022.1 hypothetical protein CLUP02_17533 [Colletotrichum lupini]
MNGTIHDIRDSARLTNQPERAWFGVRGHPDLDVEKSGCGIESNGALELFDKSNSGGVDSMAVFPCQTHLFPSNESPHSVDPCHHRVPRRPEYQQPDSVYTRVHRDSNAMFGVPEHALRHGSRARSLSSDENQAIHRVSPGIPESSLAHLAARGTVRSRHLDRRKFELERQFNARPTIWPAGRPWHLGLSHAITDLALLRREATEDVAPLEDHRSCDANGRPGGLMAIS